MLLAVLGTGCSPPLSVQDEFFSPLNDTVAAQSAQTGHALNRYRALQAVRRACGTPPASDISGPPGAGGPELAPAAAHEALAELCAPPVRPPAALGATSNAYRRWLNDAVRELPDPSESAASSTTN